MFCLSSFYNFFLGFWKYSETRAQKCTGKWEGSVVRGSVIVGESCVSGPGTGNEMSKQLIRISTILVMRKTNYDCFCFLKSSKNNKVLYLIMCSKSFQKIFLSILKYFDIFDKSSIFESEMYIETNMASCVCY